MDNIQEKLGLVIEHAKNLQGYLDYENETELAYYMQGSFDGDIDEMIQILQSMKINKGR